jgi:hypothetical protein
MVAQGMGTILNILSTLNNLHTHIHIYDELNNKKLKEVMKYRYLSS